ncbi:MAG: hypothetical protein QF668_08215 [Arenicellales bacterium]|jgi:hypothetical protein|nr:hypothetical protein [Arenicellales bacterium]MDP6672944.1 hypothetical protein [Arenicellales bacterium]MDP7154727.1 hypothetical protein [Arenicellales bacterium]|tara:strand:- start:1817 stop:1963 length:147 start_codon:yes stop_codon:yes gene_type:complete
MKIKQKNYLLLVAKAVVGRFWCNEEGGWIQMGQSELSFLNSIKREDEM